MKLDKFGINYGDVSIGWKALHWVIPEQIKYSWYQFLYKLTKNEKWIDQIMIKHLRQLL